MVRSWLRSEFEAILKAEAKQGLKVTLRERVIREEKKRIVEEAKELLKKYRTFALIDLSGLPAKALVTIRKALEGKAVVKLIKNTLFEKAIDDLKIKNCEEVKKYLSGQNIIVFTNMNAFELKSFLDKLEITVKARPGMKIDREIVVPPMRTELKPGPIMSLFSRFRIPVQVREGVIWIARETTIAKPGDVVTVELTSLFEKLGIEPIIVKPRIKMAYDEGVVIPGDMLILDIEGTKNDLLKATVEALNVAAEIALPVPDVLNVAIRKAFQRAVKLAAEAGFVTKETAEHVVREAVARATLLSLLLASKSPELAQALQVQMPVVQQPAEVKEEKLAEEKKEEEEKKEVSEEQLAEGLAALFG